MKLFIPTIGNILKLTDDWEFDVFNEYRNEKLIDRFFRVPETGRYARGRVNVLGAIVFPEGTVLRVERIYIRGTNRDYDSITFRVKSFPDDPKPKGLRFWVKLHDANQMECEVVDE